MSAVRNTPMAETRADRHGPVRTEVLVQLQSASSDSANGNPAATSNLCILPICPVRSLIYVPIPGIWRRISRQPLRRREGSTQGSTIGGPRFPALGSARIFPSASVVRRVLLLACPAVRMLPRSVSIQADHRVPLISCSGCKGSHGGSAGSTGRPGSRNRRALDHFQSMARAHNPAGLDSHGWN